MECLGGLDLSDDAFDRFFALCAESLVFKVAPTHETMRWLRWEGRDAVRGMLEAAYGHAREVRFVPNTVVAEGATVLYQATEFAILTEQLHGLPAGAATEQEQTHIFEVRDGLIVWWRMFPGVHRLRAGEATDDQ